MAPTFPKKSAVAAALIFLTLGCTTCAELTRRLGLEEDNEVEEFIEEVLEDNLDVKVDLTPDSSEPS